MSVFRFRCRLSLRVSLRFSRSLFFALAVEKRQLLNNKEAVSLFARMQYSSAKRHIFTRLLRMIYSIIILSKIHGTRTIKNMVRVQ